MPHRLDTVALRTGLVYGSVAAVWILISDRALSAVVADPIIVGQLQTYKGWAFVVITTALLYVVLYRELRRLNQEAVARKQTEEQLRSHAARLQVLTDTSRSLAAATRDEPALLDLLARSTADALGSRCTICLLSEDREWLRMAAFYGVEADERELTRLALESVPLREQALTYQVVQSGQPTMISSAAKAALLDSVRPEFVPVLDRVPPYSTIIAPIHISGRVLGVLYLARHGAEQIAFGEEDVQLAQDLADRAALAICNARLYNELQQSHVALDARVSARTAELAQANATLEREVAERTQLGLQLQQQATQASALAALSQALAEAGRDLQPLFETIVQRVAGLTDDTCVLSLLSPDRKWMHPVASRSADPAHTSLLHTLLAAGPDRADVGLSAAVVASGQALLLPNIPVQAVRDQIDMRYHVYLDTLDTLSMLVVPLRAHEALIGTLAVIRDRPARPYSADDQTLLQDLADRAGLAIENARLFAAAEQSRAEAERANRAKSAFLASMSHELRTPLNAILGFTGTLLMQLPGPLNADQLRQLTTVERSGKHLLALINDILDLARIESGKVELRLAPVACQEVLAEVVDSLRPLAEQKGLTFTMIAPATPIEVTSDRRALGQILINLVNNAIKFTDAGEVSVELTYALPASDDRRSATDDQQLNMDRQPPVVVRIKDTGIGINVEDQAKLFAEFGRLGSAVVHDREGTGLGLRLSRKLAELLGARIELVSSPSAGSTFTLVLPEI